MDRPRVCAIEWDGNYLACSIEHVIFVFRPEPVSPTGNSVLRFYRRVERLPNGRWRAFNSNYQSEPEWLTIAGIAVTTTWADWQKDNPPLFTEPAFRLYYDPSAEVFDRSAEIAAMITSLSTQFNMNRPRGVSRRPRRPL